jgi:hypothetical protein
MRSARVRGGVLALAAVALLVAGLAAFQERAAAEAPTTTTVSGCRGQALGDCEPRPSSALEGTADEQLAAKYAPIVYLREQADPCEPEGYQPAPVEVVLGNPRITLVRTGPDGSAVQSGPTAADLFRARQDTSAYIDLPGRPGNPGCTYLTDFRTFGADTPAVTYAHIQREKGYLALQYWFYYYFNDWNNQHESDWEMIQLLFKADSAEQALGQDPIRVSFAQHGGGETAGWNDRKLRREGDRPVVYVSAGSHASYFEPYVYLGLGEQGSGFGCDDASGTARRVPLEARLVPARVSDENDPFAWSAFQGRWGERHPGQNNGPTGPTMKPRWSRPVTHFDENIPDYNVTIPSGITLGPSAIETFCNVVAVSGTVLGLYYESPLVVGLTGGALALIVGMFFAGVTRATFLVATPARLDDGGAEPASLPRSTGAHSALSLYLRHFVTFAGIGAIFIPIGIAGTFINDNLAGAALLFGGLPLLTAFVVVNAAVAATVKEIADGRRPTPLTGYRAVWSHLRPLLWARVKVFGITTLLAITVIGIPFAINRFIRWLFVEQAIVLNGADSRTASKISSSAVSGHWWRTLAMAIVLGVVGSLVGPICGIAALLVVGVSADAANLISSVVYALTLPLVFLAMTLFYNDLSVIGRAAPILPRLRGGRGARRINPDAGLG